MRSLMAHSLLWGACLAAGVVASAKPSAAANCALYARGVTGIALFGAAGGWWAEAHVRSWFTAYAAYESSGPALFQLAVATEEVEGGTGAAVKISGTHHRKEAAGRPTRKAAHPHTHRVAHHKPSSARAAAPQT